MSWITDIGIVKCGDYVIGMDYPDAADDSPPAIVMQKTYKHSPDSMVLEVSESWRVESTYSGKYVCDGIEADDLYTLAKKFEER